MVGGCVCERKNIWNSLLYSSSSFCSINRFLFPSFFLSSTLTTHAISSISSMLVSYVHTHAPSCCRRTLVWYHQDFLIDSARNHFIRLRWDPRNAFVWSKKTIGRDWEGCRICRQIWDRERTSSLFIIIVGDSIRLNVFALFSSDWWPPRRVVLSSNNKRDGKSGPPALLWIQWIIWLR